jgi:hypothetical protein
MVDNDPVGYPAIAIVIQRVNAATTKPPYNSGDAMWNYASLLRIVEKPPNLLSKNLERLLMRSLCNP